MPMSKRKLAPKSPIAYLWNELLFARYFEYVVDLDPDELATRINALAHQREGQVWGLLKTVDVTAHPNGKGLDFHLRSKRKSKLDLFGITTTRAHGQAVVDKVSGRTIVRGVIKFGCLLHFYLIAYALLTLITIAPAFSSTTLINVPSVLLLLLIIGVLLSFIWWRMFRDRNNLSQLLEYVTTQQAADIRRRSKRLLQQDSSEVNQERVTPLLAESTRPHEQEHT